MLQRAYSLLEVKEASDDKRVLRGIATSPTPDRVGDVIDQYGVTWTGEDLPLFLYHDSTKVVGRAKFGKANKAGVPFEAWLPKITEPGALKDRVDEAWAMVRHRLITGVSIGFRALTDGYERMKDGGIKYLKTEVLELSLTPVPCQAEALIHSVKALTEANRPVLLQEIKSADQAIRRAALGAKGGRPIVRLDITPKGVSDPGVSGQPNRRKGVIYLD